MKLKITKRKVTQEETDIDLPIYLYTQDESCHDKYVKWDGTFQTIIEMSWSGITISRLQSKLYIEDYQLNNLTTEKEFNERIEEAVSFLTFSRENKI
jgi:hypothetical protein